MYKDKTFTDYARKVAKADAGKKIGSTEDTGLPDTPDLDALKRNTAPQPKANLLPSERLDRRGEAHLDPERRNRDYGGYRAGEPTDPTGEEAVRTGTGDRPVAKRRAKGRKDRA